MMERLSDHVARLLAIWAVLFLAGGALVGLCTGLGIAWLL
jgi:hypothetical protein